MTLPRTSAPTGRFVTTIFGLGADRTDAEQALEGDGILLPFPQRAEWLRHTGQDDAFLVVARDAASQPQAAVSVGISKTRALPGHRLYRIERMCAAADIRVDRQLLDGIVDAARRDASCLRVSIEVFERNEERRSALQAALADTGFAKSPDTRSYARTLALELAPGAEALLSALNLKVRRNVREPVKRGLEIRRITDVALAPRLEELLRETYARTGGASPHFPWSFIIELAAREPNRSHVSGLFDPKAEGAESLLAFSWGVMHGDYVTYEAGGSTRRPELGRTPVAYAPLWDLISWATTTRASWFDFGGVTAGTKDSADDPLGGISDFKRHFCQDVVDVGEDWMLEPRPVRSSIARAVGMVARRFGVGQS